MRIAANRRWVLVPVALLLLTFLPFKLPYAFYAALRLAVSGAALILALQRWGRARMLAIALAVLAVLFNPILPLKLYSAAAWAPLNVGAIILLLIAAMR